MAQDISQAFEKIKKGVSDMRTKHPLIAAGRVIRKGTEAASGAYDKAKKYVAGEPEKPGLGRDTKKRDTKKKATNRSTTRSR